MTWDAATVAKLVALKADGLSYTKIGRELDCRRGAVAGAFWRHVHASPDTRSPDERHRKRPLRTDSRTAPSRNWSEQALTETWAERKARRAREARL